MKDMFLVSELAKKFNISKRTLQYYDKIDLLKPNSIMENGYRAYSIDELSKLMEIIIWKNCGLDSCDIKDIFDNKSHDNIDTILNTIDNKLAQEIEYLTYLRSNLNSIKTNLNDNNDFSICNFSIKHFNQRKVCYINNTSENIKNLGNIMDLGSLVLSNAIEKKVPLSDFGVIFNVDSIKSKLYTTYDNYFFTLPSNYTESNFNILNAGKYACLYFDGNITDLDIAIKELLSLIDKNNYKINDDIIIYTESFKSIYFKDPNKTIGELQILIL